MFNIEGIDLHREGIEYLLWKRRIRSYVDDKEDIEKMETVLHKNCRLGQWLFSSGIKKIWQCQRTTRIRNKSFGIA